MQPSLKMYATYFNKSKAQTLRNLRVVRDTLGLEKNTYDLEKVGEVLGFTKKEFWTKINKNENTICEI